MADDPINIKITQNGELCVVLEWYTRPVDDPPLPVRLRAHRRRSALRENIAIGMLKGIQRALNDALGSDACTK